MVDDMSKNLSFYLTIRACESGRANDDIGQRTLGAGKNVNFYHPRSTLLDMEMWRQVVATGYKHIQTRYLKRPDDGHRKNLERVQCFDYTTNKTFFNRA